MYKGMLIAIILVFTFAVQAADQPPPQAKAAASAAPEQPEYTKGNEKSPGYLNEQRGDEYLGQRNFPEAIKEFDAALALDPKAETVYVKKGMALYASGAPLDAVPLMDKAVQLNSRGKAWAWWPLYHKGIAQGMSGDMAGAVKSLDESIKLKPGYENYFARATAYYFQQKPDLAMADAKAAQKYKADDPRLTGFVAQLEAQIAATKYVDEMAGKKGAEKTASGLVYFDLKKGSGKSPAATDTVKVHYHGTLPDGTVFDSSVDRKEPATFPLNGVIACWTEGLQKMKVGGKAKLVCPASIAYGNQSPTPAIAPGATLVFEVELLEIQ